MPAGSESAATNRTGPDLPVLSIVVIGRNEGKRLARCLDSIRQIRGVAPAEILYVDSDSTDGSPELAGRLGATVIAVHPERPTAAIGRNAGWRRATAELILFLDGDTVLHPDFPLAACRAMLADASIAAVWGHRREMYPEASLYNRVLDLDWVYAPGAAEFCGGDVLMRRSALVETGGFDEGLIGGEEPELCRRLRARGYSILHIDHPMTGHDLQMTRWRQYWKRAARAGHAYAEVAERFRNSEDAFWQADRRRNLLRGSLWILSLLTAAAASFWYGPVPLAAWLAFLLLLSLRSAWKARWKSRNPWSLALYGIHSHLQQVPILVGQLQFEFGRRTGRKMKLIEYKDAPAESSTANL
ncbi:MAG TPA: glycosyltransferase [Terracidiphilus sp.]|nr:glycosyltransferase [Terracidiphilus sp.]